MPNIFGIYLYTTTTTTTTIITKPTTIIKTNHHCDYQAKDGDGQAAKHVQISGDINHNIVNIKLFFQDGYFQKNIVVLKHSKRDLGNTMEK